MKKVVPLEGIGGISSLSWSPQGLYLMADDRPVLYCLEPDTLTITQQLSLDPQGHLGQMPKPLKPDFEASALIEQNGKPQLLIFGSGSLSPTRETLVRVDLPSQTIVRESLAPLYQQIAAQGLEVNIEGVTAINTDLVLANRGHIGKPENHLLWLQNNSLKHGQNLQLPSEPFIGISGLEFEKAQDWLWFTASTEETSSVYDDGTIGDSYLGWVAAFSSQKEQSTLTPDQLINLTHLDTCFVGQKIEAVALSPEHIYLGADNDGGQATLFVLSRND